jgi:hypothetical protein
MYACGLMLLIVKVLIGIDLFKESVTLLSKKFDLFSGQTGEIKKCFAA